VKLTVSENRSEMLMRRYYTKTLGALQLAIGLVCWMTYRAAAPDLGPAATVFIVMQVGAVAGSIWANRLRRRIAHPSPPSLSRVLN
jgi:hypothetical protein